MKKVLLSSLVFAAGLVAGGAEALICEKTPNQLAEYEALTAKQKQALGPQPGDPTLGPDEARGVIVEFIDYACPYCRRMAGDVVRLTETHPEVQIVFKEYPIISDHASGLAARASVATAGDSRWKAFHAGLMGSTPGVGIEEAILEAADAAGIDADQLEEGMFSAQTEATIQRGCRLAHELGVSATPTFVVWGLVVEGALPATMLQPLATLTLEPRDLAAQKELYTAMVQAYDPDEYRYPDHFIKMLRKIDKNWEERGRN